MLDHVFYKEYADGTEIFFVTRTFNLMKIWILFLVSTKRQKRDQREFVTKFDGIIVTIIFTEKCFSNS